MLVSEKSSEGSCSNVSGEITQDPEPGTKYVILERISDGFRLAVYWMKGDTKEEVVKTPSGGVFFRVVGFSKTLAQATKLIGNSDCCRSLF